MEIVVSDETWWCSGCFVRYSRQTMPPALKEMRRTLSQRCLLMILRMLFSKRMAESRMSLVPFSGSARV